MPSKAYSEFCRNVVDVDRLIESHRKLKSGDKGKQGLGHITRSGVVMLCASWELYIEELTRESALVLSERSELPIKLPLSVQKGLSSSVKLAKHELRPLNLAGIGWKQVYSDYVNSLTEHLNTPKSNQINELFLKTIGVKDLIINIRSGEREIDNFVTVRGDIAHRGRNAVYIKIGQLTLYKDEICKVVIEIDNFISDYIRDNTDGRKPWNITP